MANPNINSTISGSDVYLVVGGEILGTAMSMTINVSRMKKPVFAFGTVDPLAFGRGVRLITGQFDAVNLKESVVNKLLGSSKTGIANSMKFYKIDPAKSVNNQTDAIDGFDEVTGKSVFPMGINKYEIDPDDITQVNSGADLYYKVGLKPIHLDEILPVDIVIIGGNEWGKLSIMKLLQLEFTDVSWSLTIDDVAAAERVSFVARSLVPWKELQPQADA
jgi:hypothetical protein